MSKESTPVTLTAEQLQTMIATAVSAAVAEAKKPAPPTDEEVRRQQQALADRASQAQLILTELDRRRFEQTVCSHKHRTGQSHGVFVHDGNYILCQKCQGKIRPAVEKSQQLDKQAIYDTDLFNRLFQEMGSTDM